MDEEISKQFLCGLPIHRTKWNENLSLINEANQKQLLEITLNHPMCKKYPIKSSYARFFLKKILDQVERSGGTVNELIYEEYVKLLERNNLTFAFKSYFVPDLLEYVPIQESCCLLSNGTTGLTTWEGSFVLTEFILSNKDIINDMNVLELGSGAGFAGIVLCKACEPSGFCFSDYHSDVMSLLEGNLGMNFPKTIIRSNVKEAEDMIRERNCEGQSSGLENVEHFSRSKNCDCDISILKLDWCNPPVSNTDIFKKFLSKTEVVLAADVVFDPSLVPYLVDTLNLVMHKPLQQSLTTAYFAITVRNRDTYDVFVEEVKKCKLILEQIDYKAPEVFYFDRSSDVRLLKITTDDKCM